jgi:MFS family permease
MTKKQAFETPELLNRSEYHAQEHRRLDTRERHVLITTCFGHFMSHLNMLVFPALVLPLAERLGMEMAAVLGISFWMYLLFGVTALPWGLAADRWGAGPLMQFFYLGSGLSAASAAFWIDSPTGLLLSLAALGLFSGIYHPTGLGLISKEMRRVSLGMGFNGMFGNLGLAMAPFLTGLINWTWGPQAAYLFIGGLNLSGMVLMSVFSIAESESAHTADSRKRNGLLGAFVFLLVAMMLGGIAYRGATVILPAYFELKNQNIFQWMNSLSSGTISKNLLATTVTSLIYMVGILGQYTGGRVAGQFDPKSCYLVFNLIGALMAFAMALSGDLPLVAFSTFYFFFLLGMQPIENTMVAQFTPKRFHHSAYGTKFVLTFGVGAIAVKMVGAIEAHSGIETVFWSLGLISFVLVGVVVLLIRYAARMKK